MTGFRPSRNLRKKNVIGIVGLDPVPGAPITNSMCKADGGATMTLKGPRIFWIGALTPWIYANGPTKPITRCPSNTKRTKVASWVVMPMASS